MTEQYQRAGLQIYQAIAFDRLSIDFQQGTRGVESHSPAAMIEFVRNAKGHRFVMPIEEQQEIRVLGALSMIVANFRGGAVHEHTESAHPAAVFPVLAFHAFAVGPEPNDVFVRMLCVLIMIVECAAVKIRMPLAIADHATREFEELGLRRN